MEGANPQVERFLYSRKDAAQALSISVRSIDYLIERGELPTRRIGKKVLIPAVALRQFARGDHPEALRSTP
jgi:excisionase family DNA binding protein